MAPDLERAATVCGNVCIINFTCEYKPLVPGPVSAGSPGCATVTTWPHQQDGFTFYMQFASGCGVCILKVISNRQVDALNLMSHSSHRARQCSVSLSCPFPLTDDVACMQPLCGLLCDVPSCSTLCITEQV